MRNRTNIALVLAAVLIIALVIAWNATRPDYAAEAINRIGGNEALYRKLEDPRGKTPQQARASRALAKSFRDADLKHRDP